MKYSFLVLLLLLFISAYGQEINEEKIVKVNPLSLAGTFNIVYDSKNDDYAYLELADTNTYMSRIISDKGNSKVYGDISTANILFDDEGNYFAIAGNDTYTDSSKYYFIKNGKELEKFQKITGQLTRHNKILYFIGRKNNRESLYKYDIQSGKLSHEKEYDHIKIPYKQINIADDYNAVIPFNSKGEIYYIAGNESGEMLVIGKSESQPFAQIDQYTVREDAKGNLAFIASDIPDSYDEKYLIYKNEVYSAEGSIGYEYDFDYTTGLPVYYTSELQKDSSYHDTYWRGREKMETFEGQISELKVAPDGKIVLIVSYYKSPDTSYSYVVIDGKKSEKLYSAYGIELSKQNDIFYIAAPDTTNYFVMKNFTKISDSYSNISYMKILPDGRLFYAAFPYSPFEESSSECYIFINEKRFGAFNLFFYNYDYDPFLVTTNESGDFAFTINENSAPADGDDVITSIITNTWTAKNIGFVSDLNYYKKDLYYSSWFTSKTDDNGYYRVFKNKTAISDKYDSMSDYKFNKEKKEITFIGMKNDAYYYVTIKL
jgi:hypothetical protein